MSAAQDVLTGAALVAGTSAWSASDVAISHDGISRNAIETSHLATAAAGTGKFGNRTFMPGDLSDPGSIQIEGFFNPDTEPPIDQVLETWTLTFAASGGDGTGATFAFSGFMTEFSWQGDLDGDVMKFTATIKISGEITQTAGSV